MGVSNRPQWPHPLANQSPGKPEDNQSPGQACRCVGGVVWFAGLRELNTRDRKIKLNRLVYLYMAGEQEYKAG